jgi:hypothetical protein
MILAVLVAELELREAELLQKPFIPLQGMLFLQVVGAALRRALVDRAVVLLLPAIEGASAVRTPVTGGASGTMAGSQLRQVAADFAAQLGLLAAIVKVEEIARGAAAGAATSRRREATTAPLDGSQRPTLEALVLAPQLPPVQFRRWGRGSRRLPERRLGIDVKIAVVRMLLAEVVARLNLRLAPRQYLLQLLDEFLQIGAGEFSAEPKHQSWYLAHGGESLRNPAGSANQGLRRETSPLFSSPIKPHRTHSALRLEPSISTPIRSKAGGESRNPSFPQQVKELSA